MTNQINTKAETAESLDIQRWHLSEKTQIIDRAQHRPQAKQHINIQWQSSGLKRTVAMEAKQGEGKYSDWQVEHIQIASVLMRLDKYPDTRFYDHGINKDHYNATDKRKQRVHSDLLCYVMCPETDNSMPHLF